MRHTRHSLPISSTLLIEAVQTGAPPFLNRELMETGLRVCLVKRPDSVLIL
ncbi:MAG: hypothetical protein ACP5PQ_03060 [Thermoproteota archaeon]